ncbi:transport system permease protein [Methanococcus aeolicus Nankai-3]|uniref:Transport system permease protein n=1 Tax=Methanococcus aeolicus (strain ATCC BAA-1280 / DSM 17508 / OCM 812 / Nankai-3) TaxID=419665 RepID=A6UT83_META3|nr:iron ABC transporter permease [Methanococcus aeolicus]ABR55705.1 transport system permease protein [Methanococcus aeolicus Nankai-3]
MKNGNKHKKSYRYLVILLLVFLSAVLPIVGIYYGGNAKTICCEDVTNFVMLQSTGDEFKDFMLKEVRLPPILGAILIGLTLSGAGLMLQTLFRNLLASPYTTGISSGVLLIVALVIFINSVSSLLDTFGTDKILIAGWCGGLLSMTMLIIIALRVKESNGVIIVALLLSYLFGGIRSYLIANAQNIQVQEYWEFMVGTITKIHIPDITNMLICTIIFILLSIFLIKPLNALLFGEKYAKSFGLNVKKTRILILLTTSFIVGAIIPYVGLIAFVGIASPYLARPLIKTSDHRWLMPTTMLLGVVLMLLCHIISLKYFVPIYYIYEISRPASPLPIGSVLDILGGLLVIYMVYRGEKKIRI